MYSTGQPFLGQGGPAPTTIDLSRGTQFFVRFPQSHGATVYLLDKSRKVLVPFTSEQGFTTFTGGKTPEQAYNSGEIYDLPPEMQQQLGVVVPDQYGFGDNGQVMDASYYQNMGDTSGLDGLYGKTKNPDLEKTAADNLGILFTTLKNSGAITQATFDQTIKDPVSLAKYINAWVYGGYTADDIFRDVKAKELGLNVKAFDPTIPATEFQKTSDYALVKNNAQLTPPTNLGIDPSVFSNPVFSIPGDAFKTLIPAVDINSPSFKADAQKIQDAYYDLLLQQLDATTTQAKTIADDNYRIFKDQVQKKYGIQLSDNAIAAWGQVQQLNSTYEDKGLVDSGIFNEAQDRLLSDRRLADQRLRDSKIDEQTLKKREYYVTQATPDQIQNDLTPQERQAWGLTPTQSTLDFINNLKSKYPDLTDEQLQNMKDSLVDQNGNLRSQLYSSLYTNKNQLIKQETSAKEKTLYNQKIAETDKAYAPYTQSDNPFVRYEGSVTPTTPTTPTSSTPATPPAAPFTYNNNTPGAVTESAVNNALQNPNLNSLNPSQPAAPTSTPTASSLKDLSSKYGLYNGTVYDLSTGLGFSKPQDFFSAAGVNDFNNVKLNTSYAPKFYKYDDNPTVYNAYNNNPLDYNSYLKSGGNSSFSGIETRKRKTSMSGTPNQSYA